MEYAAPYSGVIRQCINLQGKRQAEQVAERAVSLGITHIISSDLGRTRRIAEIVADGCGCQMMVDARLRELDIG